MECDVVLILAGPFGLVDGDGLRFGNFRGIAQLVHLHTHYSTVYSVSDSDPESGAFFDPWIRDPGWVKNQDPDPG